MCDKKRFDFRTFPVIDSDGKFAGIITGDDFKYPDSLSATVAEAMTPAKKVKSAPIGTPLQIAYTRMQRHKVNTLPLLNEDGTVAGLYLFSDVSRLTRDAVQYNVDTNGQLRVGAAVSTGKDALRRVTKLSKYVDVIFIDSADGDSYYALETLRRIKDRFPELDVVAGNVSDGASARLLAEAGADGIKVGQGPGSICSTRREMGIGMPQVTAVYDCIRALGQDFGHIPVCADGGIREHGDISIAFAAGAHSVMMGKLLAGTTEAPGEVIIRRDGTRVKAYRGMGSLSALEQNEASRLRYASGQTGALFVPEGVEGYVPYEGHVRETLELCLAALRKSMRYVKAPNLTDHRENTRLVRITGAGLVESHPHDIEIM